jgi:MFS family permease
MLDPSRPKRSGGLVQRLLPPTGLARRISVQMFLLGTGIGTFLAGSAVYFTEIVGLSATQVGAGLTLAGVASSLVSIPMGRLSDRVGSKRMWALSAATAVCMYLLWPTVTSVRSFFIVITALKVAERTALGARGAYILEAFSRDDAVRSMAFVRVAGNIGLLTGASISGIALALASNTLVRAIPLASALILTINVLAVVKLPRPSAHAEGPQRERGEKAAVASRPGALRNPGFTAVTTLNGVLYTWDTLLNVVIPIWLVQETDAPRVLLAGLFGTNAVICVLAQVRVAGRVDSLHGALRASRISAVFFVASCLMVMVTHDTLGLVTVLLVWAGHMVLTGAEMFQAAGQWGYVTHLSDPHRRGEYQGMDQLGMSAGSLWAPAAYTFLAMHWGTAGWLVIACVPIVASACLGTAARSATAFLSRDPHDDTDAVRLQTAG